MCKGGTCNSPLEMIKDLLKRAKIESELNMRDAWVRFTQK